MKGISEQKDLYSDTMLQMKKRNWNWEKLTHSHYSENRAYKAYIQEDEIPRD